MRVLAPSAAICAVIERNVRMVSLRSAIFTVVAGLLWTCIATTDAGAADAPPVPVVVSFSGTTVHASGITSGREAIIFGCTIDRFSSMRRLRRRAEVVRDTDADGAVDLPLSTLPVVSVWAVVDLESGRYALATPPGFAAPVHELSDDVWKSDELFLDIERDFLEILVVRPGSGPHSGAWTLMASEGGSNDGDDHLNKRLRMTMARLKHLHGADATPQPGKVQKKDL
ncbi:hypothetical protein L0Y59_00125, partial [Candidatus Uhrbacteria bacterium]|nr:hypothetical protein [Candidatus Uhrbacteria bacterium]